MDVKNEFLHDKLHEIIYVHQLMGFCNLIHPDYIYLLKKSLHSKQTPHAWYQMFADLSSKLVSLIIILIILYLFIAKEMA